MNKVPKEEIFARVMRFQEKLAELNLDGTLICQGADLYYFTGSTQNGFLFIPTQGDPLLLIKKSYPRAQEETCLPVVPLISMKTLQPAISDHLGYTPTRLGLEYDVLPVANWFNLQRSFPDCKFVDVSYSIRSQRAVKSSWEIERIKVSCQLLNTFFAQASGLIKDQQREIDLARELDYLARELGHQGLVRMRAFNQDVFMGQVMAGANASQASAFDGPAGGRGLSPAFPFGASTHRIEAGQPILVDYSAVVDGYVADMTRVFCIGSLDQKLTKAHQASIDIVNAILAEAKAGTAWSTLYERSCQLVAEVDLTDYFMGFGPDKAKFVGHGVGIELDEYPILATGFKEQLLPGMIFALEPKFVFPDRGVVGIEDTCLVTEDGSIPLTFCDRGIIYVNK